MLPDDGCRVTGVIVAGLAPGVWQVQLPNGHRLVARVRRRQWEQGLGRTWGPGQQVPLWVTPADMTRALVVEEGTDRLNLESVKP